jgi:hypothetical protein
MNFTSFRVYFHIKNQISNSFNQIKIALDWAHYCRGRQGPWGKCSHDTDRSRRGRRVEYRDLRGFFCIMAWPKEYWGLLVARSKMDGED